MKTLLLLALSIPLFAQAPIVINAGGSNDSGFTGATTAYTIPSTSGTMRYGQSFAYDIPIPGPCWYTVLLQFVEPTVTAAGQRVFSVTANDQPIIQNLDLVASAGLLTPLSRASLVYVAGKTLHLAFVASTRNAVISTITIAPNLQLPPPLQQQSQEFVASLDAAATVFTLASVPNSVPMVFVNGSLARPGAYAVAGNVITFGAALNQGDIVRVVYQ